MTSLMNMVTLLVLASLLISAHSQSSLLPATLLQSTLLPSTLLPSTQLQTGGSPGQTGGVSVSGSPGASSPQAMSTQLLSSTPQAVSTQPPCPQTWVQFNNTNAQGGFQVSANNLAACQQACISNASCTGLDFVTASSQCFLIFSANAARNNGGAAGVTHYDLTRNFCNSSTAAPATPSACGPTFNLTSNVNVPGGTVNSTANTVADCQAACIALPTCNSIDFTSGNLPGGRCYTNRAQSPQNNFTGNSHYDLIRIPPSCQSTTSSTVTAATASPANITTCKQWYVKTGGVVAIDPASGLMVVSYNFNQAACFLQVSPCLGSSVNAAVNTSNCLSLTPYGANGTFSRIAFNSLAVQPQAAQIFPQRFAEDASFWALRDFFNPGYISLQPVIYANNTYYYVVMSDGTIQPVPLAKALTMKDSGSFLLKDVPLPNTQVTATCNNVWTRINNVAGPRPVNLNVMPLSTCRQACLVYPNCVAVSYNYVNKSCSLETRPPPNASLTRLTLAMNFTYFELNTAYPDLCARGDTSVFSSASNTSLTNSVVNVSVSNYNTCRMTCLNSYQGPPGVICLGINYDNGTGNCSTVYAGPGSVNVTLTNYQTLIIATTSSGPCSPKLTASFDYDDVNGVQQTGISTLDACRTACINNQQCFGYDWYNSQCYFSLTPAPVLSPLSTNLHVDIIRSSCGAGCRDKWDFSAESTATPMTSAVVQSEMDCRQLCQSVPTCSIINWNYLNNTCTWGTAASVRNFPGTSPGWSQYSLYREPICDRLTAGILCH